MPTLSTTIKQFIVTATANADFQAKVQLIHDFFGTTCGWTQAADSGQINPASVAFPGANNTDAGQEVWYMADALQATRPVAIRLRYGRGADANDWRLRISVSMSLTNGSLVFLGQESDILSISFATAGARTNSDSTAYRISGSGSTNRAVLALFYDVISTPRGGFFYIERTKNADGTDNGDGVVARYQKFGAVNVNDAISLEIDYEATGFQPVWRNQNGTTALGGGTKNYLHAVSGFGTTVRSTNDQTSTLHKGKVSAFPYKASHPGWKYPQMSMLLCAQGDFPLDFTPVAIPFYGSDHDYLPLSSKGGGVDTQSFLVFGSLIRFE